MCNTRMTCAENNTRYIWHIQKMYRIHCTIFIVLPIPSVALFSLHFQSDVSILFACNFFYPQCVCAMRLSVNRALVHISKSHSFKAAHFFFYFNTSFYSFCLSLYVWMCTAACHDNKTKNYVNVHCKLFIFAFSFITPQNRCTWIHI